MEVRRPFFGRFGLQYGAGVTARARFDHGDNDEDPACESCGELLN